ncbi:uncharacterized protein LOC125943626 isoform X1 [Dermacentor silvarum]|uniref:uncharacterized protein LOC125943626 isoform X1 n=1 Tax=Dermacentor silvarum TaxID=543639 RepID=UPI002100DDDE|nr:uncharacterized protein LOC125943626 isoform X1 [Dermacentor silvarum]
MTSTVLRSMRERVAAWARLIRRGWLPATTTSSEHVDDEAPGNGPPNLRAGNELTEAPFIFSMKYIQTAAGAFNLTETVVQQLLYHCVGSVVFLVCGIYVLARYFNASNAIVASVVSLVSAALHLANAIYVYRGDFQRMMDAF